LKLLLDTTYLLPAIGISVKNLPKNASLTLLQGGHLISISQITLFELAAKGAKYVAIGKNTTRKSLQRHKSPSL